MEKKAPQLYVDQNLVIQITPFLELNPFSTPSYLWDSKDILYVTRKKKKKKEKNQY